MRPLQDRIRGLLDRSPEGGIFLPVVSTLVVIHILIDDVLAVPIV